MRLNLKSGNQNLSANLIQPPRDFQKPISALIFIHGWESDQTGNIERAEELAKLGFVCLTLDLRGHGQSDGKLEEFSRKDHLEDVIAVYDFLVSQSDVDKENIGVIGASYGGYLASILVGERKIKWLVMRVPALYFDNNFDVPTSEIIEKDENAFTSDNLIPENSLPLKAVSEFSGNILLIESENDSIIPHSTIENYLKFIDEQNLTYKLMRDTAHDLRTVNQQRNYINILIKWFKKL